MTTPVPQTASPVETETPVVPAPAVVVPTDELARVAQGMTLLFWGSFALLAGAVELLLAPTVRAFPTVVGGAGAAGLCSGAWWLRATPSLGVAWRRAVWTLLFAAAATAYLTPFCWMWRQVPLNLYLLVHAMIWLGMFLFVFVAANECVRALGHKLGSRSLVWQGSVFGVLAFVVLLGGYFWIAPQLLRVAWRGTDPLMALQNLLPQLPTTMIFLLLAPISLTMSLVWTAKDLALQRLTAKPGDPILNETKS